MNYMLLVITFFVSMLQFNGAKQMNVDVILHSKDIFSLFSEDEIWGMQYKNKTQDIVQLNVVIDEMDINRLKKVVISFDIIYPDIDIPIHKEQERLNNRTKWTAEMKPDIFFLDYRNWPEYLVFLDALLLRFPNLITRSYMGPTIQGRDIRLFTLSTGDGSKPALYIQAEVHSREWLANAACMYILNALAEGYGVDTDITEILDAINIYIAPTINIDGYIYTWQTERMWRKNRRDNVGTGTFGVDLNRNYDGPAGTWGCSQTNPSSNTYCGTSPYSEPEVQAIASFVLNDPISNPMNVNNVVATVDMHTSGPLILYPWAYTQTPVPSPYYDEYVALAQDISTAIENVHGVVYTPTQFLGTSAGTMRDFPFGISNDQNMNRIFSFTWEGRGPGFDPPASNILPAGEEQLAGMLTLARFVMNRELNL